MSSFTKSFLLAQKCFKSKMHYPMKRFVKIKIVSLDLKINNKYTNKMNQIKIEIKYNNIIFSKNNIIVILNTTF